MTHPEKHKPILLVAGARPNFVKVAALWRALAASGPDARLVHTGQHYDPALSDIFFQQLGLPAPDAHLGVGSGPHGEQTGRIMAAFEPVLHQMRPRVVVVVGDVNSTMACALVTAKAVYDDGSRPGLVHVEAGLRSGDRAMPEEINRLVTDHVADRLYCSEPAGEANLRAEGVAPEKIRLVGNVMIDTMLRLKAPAAAAPALAGLGLDGGRFGLITLHRPQNVDHPATLARLLEALLEAAARVPLLLAAHPRTLKVLADPFFASLKARLGQPRPGWLDSGGLALTGPLPYLDFLGMMQRAAVVLTDSGGIQEETTALGVPCVTIRPNTERPITLERGLNRLAPRPEDIGPALAAALALRGPFPPPPLWDGRAAERIAADLAEFLASRA